MWIVSKIVKHFRKLTLIYCILENMKKCLFFNFKIGVKQKNISFKEAVVVFILVMVVALL